MPGKDLKGIVERVVDLPTLPQVVTKIMQLIEDPRSTARSIHVVMQNDPALAAKILKLVNSSFYGLPNRITSIQQAITILGFNTIKSLAISASVFDLFGMGMDTFSYEAFWTQSIGCAGVCHHVGKQVKYRDLDSVFVVGLLHGIGKLILDQYAPVEFQEILQRAKDQGLSFEDAERQVIDTSYADIGYWLAVQWKLAELVQNSVMYQNRLEEAPEEAKDLVAVLQISRYLCRVTDCGAGGDFDEPTVPEAACAVFGLEGATVAELTEEVREKVVAQTGDFMMAIRT